MKVNPSLNAWTDINSLLRNHKLINIGLIVICVLQIFVIGLMYFDDPIVVIKENEYQSYHVGKRSTQPISEEAVKRFVTEFLKLRYQWKKLDPQAMRKSLEPVVTDGLSAKLIQLLTHLKDQEFQGKETSQSIVNIDVKVTEEKVVASFDKLLRIEGIPIPVPTTVSLSIIQGSPNDWNPIGLFVNGIMEHQSK